MHLCVFQHVLCCDWTCFWVVMLMTYREEAVEVREIKSMSDLSQAAQGQLSLIGRFAALIRRAPQGRHMPWMQWLHQELNREIKQTKLILYLFIAAHDHDCDHQCDCQVGHSHRHTDLRSVLLTTNTHNQVDILWDQTKTFRINSKALEVQTSRIKKKALWTIQRHIFTIKILSLLKDLRTSNSCFQGQYHY